MSRTVWTSTRAIAVVALLLVPLLVCAAEAADSECIASHADGQKDVDATSLMQGKTLHIEHFSGQNANDVGPRAAHPSPPNSSIEATRGAAAVASSKIVGQAAEAYVTSIARFTAMLEEYSKHGASASESSLLFYAVGTFMGLSLSCFVLASILKRREDEAGRPTPHGGLQASGQWRAPLASQQNRRSLVSEPNLQGSVSSRLTPVVLATRSSLTLGNVSRHSRITLPATPAQTSQLEHLSPLAFSASCSEPEKAPEFATPNMSPRSLDVARPKKLPPALCQAMVLPLCEVRFGIAMKQLWSMRVNEELTIVGLSGNTLLRGHVKKAATGHMLEIMMPEASSTPRAVVKPSAHDAEVFDIIGFRGKPYGLLHVRSSSACYVTYKGNIVMAIDGDSNSLQLWLKTDDGQSLASMRCTCESFANGEDHLEIRVEPGVDSVLVLACVLSVLLLSPYHHMPGFLHLD